MKLDIDFSPLDTAVKKMGPPIEISFDLGNQLEPWEIKLGEGGIEISLDEIEYNDALLSYRGRQVLLYIQDHQGRADAALEDGTQGRKYHVAECSTLQKMRDQGRFERYVVTNDMTGDFYITGYDYETRKLVEGHTRLKVCRNCLQALNYKGYKSDSNKSAFSQFSIEEFFRHYSSYFKTMPKRLAGKQDQYTDDWADISRKVRQAKNFICEDCNVDLSSAPRLCHVHHINGVRSDNSGSNLKVLCADCHSKQPMHSNMFVLHKDRQAINKLRNIQHGDIRENWSTVLAEADPATEGLLRIMKKHRQPLPIVGYELLNQNGEVAAELELAWPKYKRGIAISEEARTFGQSIGWRVDLPQKATQYLLKNGPEQWL